MKKGIEQDDLPNNNHSWLAEHDYSSKYPVNCYNFVQDDSENESENVIQFRNNSHCSTIDNSSKDGEGDSSSSYESDSSTDDSASEADDTDKHVWPWMNINVLKDHTDELVPISFYEEHHVLEDLETFVNVMPERELDPSICQFYSKLKLRRLKRLHGCDHFDFDDYLRLYHERKRNKTANIDSIVIPKQLTYIHNTRTELDDTLLSRGVFPDTYNISSQYTNRILKPFIWRDFSCRPPYLKVLHEINKKKLEQYYMYNADFSSQDSIDYSYLKPYHIQTINNICCEYFWPGIDLSDSLQYPDFSCIALYKKIIVGFAFLTPDVSPTETYLSFLFTRPQWRGSGIATFMIYHLIQTCMGKDITLHVAADNPAVLLYQKFGFKVEEIIYNFYDKYLPIENKGCKHALFLRLSR